MQTNDKTKSKKIWKCLIILILVLLIVCIMILYILLHADEHLLADNANNNVTDTKEMEVMPNKKLETIQDVAEKYHAEFIKREQDTIYFIFEKDLYDEKGNSNESYFQSLIEDLCQLETLQIHQFTLIDEEKNISIIVTYNLETRLHEIEYNHIKDFYKNSNGDAYIHADTVEIAKKTPLTPASQILFNLTNGGMFFKKIRNSIGIGQELDNGYTSYQNGNIEIKVVDYRVNNIIFKKGYEDEVFSGITVGTDLEKIYNKYENYSNGTPNEGYLFYRTKDVYAFFYNDEISVYGYTFYENENFEKYLATYLEDKDFSKFIESVTKNWTNYETFEYDPDIQYAHITYPSRGLEINIKDNDSTGILLYKNYYITNLTKQYIKNGQISLNYHDDLLELSEIERRKNR